jgi:hypothetical protein
MRGWVGGSYGGGGAAVLPPVRCSRAARGGGEEVSWGWGVEGLQLVWLPSFRVRRREIPGPGAADRSKQMRGSRVPAWLETSPASFEGCNRRSGSRVAPMQVGCTLHILLVNSIIEPLRSLHSVLGYLGVSVRRIGPAHHLRGLLL